MNGQRSLIVTQSSITVNVLGVVIRRLLGEPVALLLKLSLAKRGLVRPRWAAEPLPKIGVGTTD